MHHIAGRGLPLPQVYALVVTEFPVGHVAVVADDLPDVLGGHVLFLRVHEAEFSLLRIALGLQLLPLAGCGDREAAGSGPVPLGRMRVQGPALPTFLLQLLLRHVVGQRRQRAGHRGAAAAVREDGGHGDAPAGVERSSGQGRGHPRPLPRHPHRHPPPTPGPHRPRPPSPAAATPRTSPPQWRPSAVATAPQSPGCGRGAQPGRLPNQLSGSLGDSWRGPSERGEGAGGGTNGGRGEEVVPGVHFRWNTRLSPVPPFTAFDWRREATVTARRRL